MEQRSRKLLSKMRASGHITALEFESGIVDEEVVDIYSIGVSIITGSGNLKRTVIGQISVRKELIKEYQKITGLKASGTIVQFEKEVKKLEKIIGKYAIIEEPEEGGKGSQMRDVKNHLRKHGSLDMPNGRSLYGVTRLADLIWRLREKEGWSITTQKVEGVNRHGRKRTYAKYVLDEG